MSASQLNGHVRKSARGFNLDNIAAIAQQAKSRESGNTSGNTTGNTSGNTGGNFDRPISPRVSEVIEVSESHRKSGKVHSIAVASSADIRTGDEPTSQEQAWAQLNSDLDRGGRVTLSRNDIMLAAWHYESTTVCNVGEWRALWAFTQVLKTHPDFSDADAGDAIEMVEAIIVRWAAAKFGLREHRRLEAKGWAEYFSIERDDAIAQFTDIWAKVRLPYRADPLRLALRRAKADPLHFTDDVLSLQTGTYRAFITLAAWLQVITGSEPILLPVHSVAPLLGVRPKTISIYREAAIADQFLAIDTAHHSTAKRATRFRFNVNRVPIIAKAAHQDAQRLYDEVLA